MRCPKCDGFMIFRSFFDRAANFEAFHCLNCGKIIMREKKMPEPILLRTHLICMRNQKKEEKT